MGISALFDAITSIHTPVRSLIIGIDGLGGAGKSTIAAALADALTERKYHPVLLHIDHFIHPRAVRYNDDHPQWECYYRLQWRYDYLREKLLSPVRNGEAPDTIIELYNLKRDDYDQHSFSIPAGSIVILEGVFLQRTELCGLFDLMAYVDVPEEIRLQRVLKRDGYIGDCKAITEKYEQRYFPAEHYYVQECRPAEHADIIIT